MEVMGREKSDKSTNQGPARMCNLCMCWEQGREQASYEHQRGSALHCLILDSQPLQL